MDTNKTPPRWRRPEDVMKLHKLRLKKRSLDFRLTDQDKPQSETKEVVAKPSTKRNPFKYVLQPSFVRSYVRRLFLAIFS